MKLVQNKNKETATWFNSCFLHYSYLGSSFK